MQIDYFQYCSLLQAIGCLEVFDEWRKERPELQGFTDENLDAVRALAKQLEAHVEVTPELRAAINAAFGDGGERNQPPTVSLNG